MTIFWEENIPIWTENDKLALFAKKKEEYLRDYPLIFHCFCFLSRFLYAYCSSYSCVFCMLSTSLWTVVLCKLFAITFFNTRWQKRQITKKPVLFPFSIKSPGIPRFWVQDVIDNDTSIKSSWICLYHISRADFKQYPDRFSAPKRDMVSKIEKQTIHYSVFFKTCYAS